MSEKHRLLLTSAAIRKQIDRFSCQERERTSAAEFLHALEERNIDIRSSTRAMIERLLNKGAEPLKYDALFAAADDFVACCGGDVDHAFEVLEVYKTLSRKGNKIESESTTR